MTSQQVTFRFFLIFFSSTTLNLKKNPVNQVIKKSGLSVLVGLQCVTVAFPGFSHLLIEI